MALNLTTPGVYTNEVSSFPNAVVPVATAIPAFIGYTARADYNGKSYLMEPVEINSMNDFLTFFGAMAPGAGGAPAQFAPPSGQYDPVYYVTASKGQGDVVIGGTPYDIQPDPGTIYYLYNAIRLFYENGGGTAFVVSVGFFGQGTGKPNTPGTVLVNPNVKYNDLQAGLNLLANEQDPTMLVIPDAVLLPAGDNSTLMQNMLNQAGGLGSRIAILDVQNGDNPDPELWMNDITAFRTATGMNSLNYGTAYYPFLQTTIAQDGDIDFNNIGGGAALAKILPNANQDPLLTILNNIQKPPAQNAPTVQQSDAALLIASPDYSNIHDIVLEKINTLPPSAAMAGVMTMVDNSEGVWKAPANVSLTAVTNTTLKLTDATQGPLNVDATTGKSINAIRLFTGKGVIVWGARTLDGNSLDWRYLNVRRTMIMIEQSVKLAANAYVFEPNVAATWSTVSSMISNFLTTVWQQGGLAGATPSAAFNVAVGLGTTMTADDILNGIMRISVQVAITHPAEYLVITYAQKMQES